MPNDRSGFLSPSAAARISKNVRMLLRAGELTHRQVCVLEAMLWNVRRVGSAAVTVSYQGLQTMAHVSRSVVADAVKEFERLGLVRKIKRKALVLWANGGRKWKQLVNEYVFCAPDCEFAGQTEYAKQDLKILTLDPMPAETKAAQEGLAAAAERMTGRIADDWRRKRGLGQGNSFSVRS